MKVDIANNQQFCNLTGSISTNLRSSNILASAGTKAASRSSREYTSSSAEYKAKNLHSNEPTATLIFLNLLLNQPNRRSFSSKVHLVWCTSVTRAGLLTDLDLLMADSMIAFVACSSCGSCFLFAVLLNVWLITVWLMDILLPIVASFNADVLLVRELVARVDDGGIGPVLMIDVMLSRCIWTGQIWIEDRAANLVAWSSIQQCHLLVVFGLQVNMRSAIVSSSLA
ncbi:hypothetical protein Nepgr_014768 [Nepenthes gracilis]|uniref:Uncharacterized protein n=1 Tax=Nepenthes gracilis TaxID=150966 RepID=A0AAD3XPT2_NEPGR|nr:hypothetical protein Nepgr_014768 [Nepenthes gracilis]